MWLPTGIGAEHRSSIFFLDFRLRFFTGVRVVEGFSHEVNGGQAESLGGRLDLAQGG